MTTRRSDYPATLFRYEILGATAPSTAAVIRKIFRVYFPLDCSVLDTTPGQGNFWERGEYPKLDASLADFRVLPFGDASWDVVAFDPPHLAGLGRSSYFRSRYGTYQASELPGVIAQGAAEAWRVARLGAIVKVTDHVNSAYFKRETQWVIDAIGQEPFDVIHVLHAPVGSGRWKDEPMSARNNGSTLLVFKRGTKYHKRRNTTDTSTPHVLQMATKADVA